MIKNIFTLTLNDLAIAIKNKTVFLIFFIPLFVFFTLKLVDTKNTEVKKVRIGLIKNVAYNPALEKTILATDKIFTVTYFNSIEEGKALLKVRKLDGIIYDNNELLVQKKESITTLAAIESLNAIQQASEGRKSWITNVKALQTSDLQKESLPTWILMLVLLVGFVIMPSQVAEEKEKKLLLSLLQTPMREIEWLSAKVLMGMVLTLASVIMLQLMGSDKTGLNLQYIFTILLGSFCFSSYGIFLGFLCRTQASARILGVIFYLPHLLPSALSDFSSKMDVFAPLLPSYHFYEAIKRILFETSNLGSHSLGLIYIFAVGLLTFIGSYALMKKRWLM